MKDKLSKLKNIKFDKLKNIKLDNKKIKIILISLGVIVVGVLAFVLINNVTKTEEDKLTESLEELGREFYEDLYYAQQSKDEDKKKESLEKFKDLGIKVTLDTLTRFRTTEKNEEAIKLFVNPKTKEECDKYTSMVTIYPKSPYKKNSYKIEAYLSCGFGEEEKEKDSKKSEAPKKDEEGIDEKTDENKTIEE